MKKYSEKRAKGEKDLSLYSEPLEEYSGCANTHLRGVFSRQWRCRRVVQRSRLARAAEMERFWWSGEIEGDAFDPYRETMRAIESVLCPLLERISFGNRAEQWAYIAIIRTDDHPDYEELVKRTSKGKVLEFRLKIPYAQFVSGSRNDRIRLVLRSLSRCVSLMETLTITSEVQGSLHEIVLKTEYELLDSSAARTQ